MSESDSAKKLKVSENETNVCHNSENQNSVNDDFSVKSCDNPEDTKRIDEGKIRSDCVVDSDNQKTSKVEDVADQNGGNGDSDPESVEDKSDEDSNPSEDVEMKDQCSDDESEIIKMTLEGVEDDPNEPTVCMTAEEIQSYLMEKIKEYMKDPAVNPVLALKLDALNMESIVKQKTEELKSLRKLFERIFKDQENFLRHVGTLPKIATNDVGVGVDWPLLPSMIPKISKDFVPNPEASSPSSSTSTSRDTKTSTSTQPQSRPIECIDLTDDAD